MDIRRTIIRCSAVLVTGQLLLFLIFNYLVFTIPSNLPGTPINVRGAILGLFLIVVLIYFEKRLVRHEPETSIGELTLMAAMAELFSEAVVQLVRQFTYADFSPAAHLYEYLHGVLVMVVMSAGIGFLIAYQLKTKKVVILLLLIAVFIALINVIYCLFP